MGVDIKFTKVEGQKFRDITIDSNGDIEQVSGFETSLFGSIFLDARADGSEVLEPYDRRGWWGDIISNFETEVIGSKLWLLDQSRNTDEVLARAIGYVQRATKWLIDDDHLDNVLVTGNRTRDDISITVKLFRKGDIVDSISFTLWENTRTDT